MLRYEAVDDNLARGLGIAVRWAHLAATLLAVGAVTMIVLAGPSERVTARRWEAAVVRRARWIVVAALVTGVMALGWQAALAEDRLAAAVSAASLVRVALETTAGHVWLARHGLLLLLAAFLAAAGSLPARVDWLAVRGETLLLAAAALVLLAASGHAAAVEPGTGLAVVADGVHLLAAGAWIGGLLPLAALLKAAGTEGGADGRPYAVLAARRFSRLALMAVVVLAASGVANTVTQVGGVAALIGTPYGRLLLAKLALLVPILAIAAVNRRRLLPALSGDGARVGRPAMRGLATSLAAESALGLLLLVVVAGLATTPPARHEAPSWPLPFRLTLDAVDSASEQFRALAGSQVALLGLVGVLAWLVARARRRALLAGGLGLMATGLALALPPLVIEAWPTTFVRPRVPYHATSVTAGAALYARRCAGCHGPAGAGGTAGPLTSGRVRRHTAGDVFWWIGAGAPHRMPAFAPGLDDESRWDLVNYVRALGAGDAARTLGPTVAPDERSIVAPDFSFGVGPMVGRSLRDYRGQRAVLLVLYTLPASRPRLAQLAAGHQILTLLGVEIIAVPRDAGPRPIRTLGAEPRVLFPVVTDGAPEITATYDLFGRAPHAEFLVDRAGYLRARWLAEGEPTRELNLLLAEVQQLNEESSPAPADEHVH
jgi:putative copper resistance protein D